MVPFLSQTPEQFGIAHKCRMHNPQINILWPDFPFNKYLSFIYSFSHGHYQSGQVLLQTEGAALASVSTLPPGGYKRKLSGLVLHK